MVNVWPKKATAVGSWLGFPKNGPKQVHQCKKTNRNDTDKKHPKCQHKKDTVTLSPFVLLVDVFPCFHPRELGFWRGFFGLWKIWRKKRVRSIQESKPPKVMERAKGQVHCEKAQRARLRSMVLYKWYCSCQFLVIICIYIYRYIHHRSHLLGEPETTIDEVLVWFVAV